MASTDDDFGEFDSGLSGFESAESSTHNIDTDETVGNNDEAALKLKDTPSIDDSGISTNNDEDEFFDAFADASAPVDDINGVNEAEHIAIGDEEGDASKMAVQPEVDLFDSGGAIANNNDDDDDDGNNVADMPTPQQMPVDDLTTDPFSAFNDIPTPEGDIILGQNDDENSLPPPAQRHAGEEDEFGVFGSSEAETVGPPENETEATKSGIENAVSAGDNEFGDFGSSGAEIGPPVNQTEAIDNDQTDYGMEKTVMSEDNEMASDQFNLDTAENLPSLTTGEALVSDLSVEETNNGSANDKEPAVSEGEVVHVDDDPMAAFDNLVVENAPLPSLDSFVSAVSSTEHIMSEEHSKTDDANEGLNEAVLGITDLNGIHPVDEKEKSNDFAGENQANNNDLPVDDEPVLAVDGDNFYGFESNYNAKPGGDDLLGVTPAPETVEAEQTAVDNDDFGGFSSFGDTPESTESEQPNVDNDAFGGVSSIGDDNGMPLPKPNIADQALEIPQTAEVSTVHAPEQPSKNDEFGGFSSLGEAIPLAETVVQGAENTEGELSEINNDFGGFSLFEDATPSTDTASEPGDAVPVDTKLEQPTAADNDDFGGFSAYSEPIASTEPDTQDLKVQDEDLGGFSSSKGDLANPSDQEKAVPCPAEEVIFPGNEKKVPAADSVPIEGIANGIEAAVSSDDDGFGGFASPAVSEQKLEAAQTEDNAPDAEIIHNDDYGGFAEVESPEMNESAPAENEQSKPSDTCDQSIPAAVQGNGFGDFGGFDAAESPENDQSGPTVTENNEDSSPEGTAAADEFGEFGDFGVPEGGVDNVSPENNQEILPHEEGEPVSQVVDEDTFVPADNIGFGDFDGLQASTDTEKVSSESAPAQNEQFTASETACPSIQPAADANFDGFGGFNAADSPENDQPRPQVIEDEDDAAPEGIAIADEFGDFNAPEGGADNGSPESTAFETDRDTLPREEGGPESQTVDEDAIASADDDECGDFDGFDAVDTGTEESPSTPAEGAQEVLAFEEAETSADDELGDVGGFNAPEGGFEQNTTESLHTEIEQEAKAPIEEGATVEDAGDGFGNFGSFNDAPDEAASEPMHSDEGVASAIDKPATQPSPSDQTDDDFGDFNAFEDSSPPEGEEPAPSEEAEAIQTSAAEGSADDDDGFGEFGDFDTFEEAPPVETAPESGERAPEDSAGLADAADDEFGDFGDFDAFEEAPPSDTAAKDEVTASQPAPSINEASADDDEFGDFGDFEEFEEATEPTTKESEPPAESNETEATQAQTVPKPATAILNESVRLMFQNVFASDTPIPSHPEGTDSVLPFDVPMSTILPQQACPTPEIDRTKSHQSEQELTKMKQYFKDLPRSQPMTILSEEKWYPYSQYEFHCDGSPYADSAAQRVSVAPAVPEVLSIELPTGFEAIDLNMSPSSKAKRSGGSSNSHPVNPAAAQTPTVVDFPTTPKSGKSFLEGVIQPKVQVDEERNEEFDLSMLSATGKRFMEQLPDLSYMLKSTLSLPNDNK